MAKNVSLGRSHELSSSESRYALCGNLCGGDCSHLLERRCGSEFSQRCLDLSVLCGIRPLCSTKMTPGSGLWSRRTPRPLPFRAGASSTSRAYPSPRRAAGGRFAGSSLTSLHLPWSCLSCGRTPLCWCGAGRPSPVLPCRPAVCGELRKSVRCPPMKSSVVRSRVLDARITERSRSKTGTQTAEEIRIEEAFLVIPSRQVT